MSRRGSSARATGPLGIGRTRGFAQDPHGFYPSDPGKGAALIAVEEFAGGIWECAAGEGDLVRELADAGVPIVSTDLVDRGFCPGGVDFLKARRLRAPNIVTNPPFDHWLDFARHALELGAAKVALLGRLLLLEDFRDRADFFLRSRLSRIWIVGRSKMRPGGARDLGHKGTVAFAWYVWDRAASWRGGPVIGWAPPPGGRA